ncbi:hypothetical protein ERX46_11240 [Brumimicrobium glaciale]|uniref:Uncharacterized protein n=1 Tax=Brumimicrobium glaciale TaxID=200475 RepID=A0A4Q4KJX6_9FLAO|nr:Imm27 family immunity protein [Brumimicrobium glaciale]RYM33505.1 hypothetical protein ERX46_11240 [Brumimicrobium glaciale]
MIMEIDGKWIEINGALKADSNCKLIAEMLQNDLKVIESSEDGWTQKLEGKNNEIWKLTYPQSHLQGGGPPKLTLINE